MSHKTDLFIELSEEQQELVAGGGQLTSVDDALNTYFRAEKSVVDLKFLQQSGPNGSSIAQDLSQDFTYINTAANKDFLAGFTVPR